MTEREWEPEERFYGVDEQRDRDHEWDEHVRHQQDAAVERARERAGVGERRAPREPETCGVCGDRFWNWGAHMERCTGIRREMAS